jgi:hypothetical protein
VPVSAGQQEIELDPVVDSERYSMEHLVLVVSSAAAALSAMSAMQHCPTAFLGVES